MKKSEATTVINAFLADLGSAMTAIMSVSAPQYRGVDDVVKAQAKLEVAFRGMGEKLVLMVVDQCEEHEDCLRDEQLARSCFRTAREKSKLAERAEIGS